ncbi:MAG: biotin transporter BioY [Bacillales bacterium]|nr:biotin transporter BioY [Bacillales bacterium]
MKTNGKLAIIDICLIALFICLITICSWTTIVGPVPFTLQTFAIFLTLGLLGGRRGTLAILIYILLGAIGLPVFSNFNSGVTALLGPTGGYLLGFVFIGLIFWLIEKIAKNKKIAYIVSNIIGLIICYSFGTIWFMYVYLQSHDSITIITILSWCVFPFIIPDLIKLGFATMLTYKLKNYVPKPAFSKKINQF